MSANMYKYFHSFHSSWFLYQQYSWYINVISCITKIFPPQSCCKVQGSIFWLTQRVLTTWISFQIHLGQWLLVQLLSNASSLTFCDPACPHKRKAWDTSALPYVEAEERLQEHFRALPQASSYHAVPRTRSHIACLANTEASWVRQHNLCFASLSGDKRPGSFLLRSWRKWQRTRPLKATASGWKRANRMTWKQKGLQNGCRPSDCLSIQLQFHFGQQNSTSGLAQNIYLLTYAMEQSSSW
jgi:hypothetical protein